MKTQSFRFRGGVARVAAWHGRPDIASVALQSRGAISIDAVEKLLDQLRAAGYCEVITNALAPGPSLPLVDSGFTIRGRLHLLSHDLESLPPPTRLTRRARRADNEELLRVDSAAFDEFWRLDAFGFDQAARATPRSHTRVTRETPLVGFYLQTAVGGIPLSRSFWARFAAIDNVVAIKVAPFNRYRTLDVAFGIAQAHAEDRITLYTGNDDHIVADLITPLVVRTGNREVTLRFRGGLLGHWSVWTRGAVKLLEKLKVSVSAGAIAPEVLALDSFVTDCNAVVFDVEHDFAGCIPGCHEILRRQGLMTSIQCLDPNETLSPGQSAGIDRLYATYPELHDDAFVAANLERWRN